VLLGSALVVNTVNGDWTSSRNTSKTCAQQRRPPRWAADPLLEAASPIGQQSV